MRIASACARRVRWPIEPRGAARTMTTREALIVELRDEEGRVGLGEAAPLPGMSVDTIEDAEAAVAALSALLPTEIADPAELTTAPAARFAIETALLSLQAQRRGCAIAELLEPSSSHRVLRCAVVVDSLDEARVAIADGATTLKLKVGPGLDLALVEAITGLGARLRLDANRTWSRDEAYSHLATLAHLPIEFIEEPCRDARSLLPHAHGLPPIALDESLVDDRTIDPRLGAVILKPTLLGGFRACLDLADAARTAGIAAIVTHGLEGPIGTAACEQLALAIGGEVDVGLAPHAALAGWKLSVRAAHGSCVWSGDREYTYADLVDGDDALGDEGDALDETSPIRSVVATPELATLRAIYAALATRTPIALHHHRLADGELERQRAQLARLPPATAIVLFTSGSTKAARGVALSRTALVAACDASTLGWRDDDRWLLALSLAHAGGLAVAVRCLVARKPIVILEGDFDAPRAARLIADRRVTLASLVPAQLAALLDDPRWRPPAHLRAVLLGGAAASPALLVAAAARGVPFLVTYGMTETFGQIATAALDRAGDPLAPLVPLPGVALSGGTALAPAPIRVRGPMLAIGYLDGAPIAPELVTSDLGFLDERELHLVGRADDVIISGGENVHPLAVEAVIAATPGVRACCAFGVEDERWGEIVAVALAIDPAFDAADAATHWRAALPTHARPRRVAYVSAIPLLASGKPDRRAASRLPTQPWK